MSGRAQNGRDRLERIAALLLSLAGLAEHAAARSAPVRLIVLWILSHAEAVAADFVGAQPAMWDLQDPDAPHSLGHGPDDALALALSLRLLAFAVQAMADEEGRLPDTASLSAFVGTMARIVRVPQPAAPAAGALLDTS
jgi:hypothetical protein